MICPQMLVPHVKLEFIIFDYYGLKSIIFVEVNDLLLSVNYHEFTCGQKIVRFVSIA